MLVEAAWAAAKAPGPLRAFFIPIRARRGHQIAAVAVARKLATLCWHMLTKGEYYHEVGMKVVQLPGIAGSNGPDRSAKPSLCDLFHPLASHMEYRNVPRHPACHLDILYDC